MNLPRRGFLASAALAALVLAGGCGSQQAASAAPAAAAPQGLIAESKTDYNHAQIYREGNIVSLKFLVGRCLFTESEIDETDPDVLPVAYTRAITGALAYAGRPESLLEIGVGGARTIMYLHRHMPGLDITGVEIDPGVIGLARAHFGLREDKRLRVVIEDGRRFLMRPGQSYDVILVDAYRGTWVPETLTTAEFFTLAKARLNPGGVVAQNVEPTTLFFDRMLATIAAVFDNVEILPSTGANAVIIGYDGPKLSERDLIARAAGLQKSYAFRHPLPEIVAQRRIPQGPLIEPMRDGFPEANASLMIDKANSRDTPRARREMCE